MVAAELKVVGGKHTGQVIPLNRRKFLIGREQDCQLRPNSEMVSRHHCVFSVDDFSVRLRDLGSTNGTLVNGERIRKETVLASGDRIVIGNLEFELVVRAGVTTAEADSKVVPSVALANEETRVTSRTVLEMPAVSQPAPEPVTTQAPAPAVNETQALNLQALAAAAQPAVGSGDTTMINPAGMMPPQYPYQQMMPQMGYPGAMYPGYPYQQPMMPGFGQMYPQMMPQMGYPMQAPMMAPQAPAAAAAPAASSTIEVSLPDPETTGAKEAEAAKGSTGSNKSDTAKPTGAADAIIKQYLGRRPGG
ncbi:MAG: FHA domain-containing protein [Planctomycetaceae bacterium]